MNEPSGGARSHIMLRLISVLAIGAVAVALLVGFFFEGDFVKAFQTMTGAEDRVVVDISSAKVKTFGEVRLDGSCADAGTAEKARTGAEFNSRRDAQDRCRARIGGNMDAQLSLRVDDAGEVALEDIGGRCIARVDQTWTCLFDGR